MPKVKKVWKTTHTNHDRFQNCLLVQQEPVHGNLRIVLQLKTENRDRYVGEIDTANKTMYMLRRRDKHYMRKVGGYGFNYSVVKDLGGTLFTHVLLQEELGPGRNRYYKIPVKVMLASSITLGFKEQGFEVQKFLKHEFYEPYEVQPHYVNPVMLA